jgi:hypothetical protein
MADSSNNEKTVVSLYHLVLLTLGAATALFFLLLAMAPDGLQRELFFLKGNNFLADFFNPVAHTVTRNPYTADAHRICPPLYYLIMYPLSFLADYRSALPELYRTPVAMISAAVFMLLSEAFLFAMLWKLLKGKYKFVICVLLLFSGINLFSVERGTLVVFTAGCIAGFLHYYDSPERKKQIFSLILLSLAASLKIYPALFGVFLLKKRDWKAILFCIFLTSALGFLPLLFFEQGLGSIPQLFRNLEEYRRMHFFSTPDILMSILLGDIWGFAKPGSIVVVIRKIIDATAIIALVCAVSGRDKHRLLLATAAVICLCPVGAMPYTQLYIFPAFIIFMYNIRKGESDLADLINAICYILLLMPLQLPFYFNKLFMVLLLPVMLLTNLATQIVSKDFQLLCKNKNGKNENDAGQDTE